MAYSNPNFFGRGGGFAYEGQFVPWHQTAGQLLNFNPLINPLVPPFAPQKQYSPLLFQQNNYYSAPPSAPPSAYPGPAYPGPSFPSARPHSQPRPLPPPLHAHHPHAHHYHNNPPKTARPAQIIQISDDEEPPRPPLKAVIKEKTVIDLKAAPPGQRNVEMKKNEKQIIAKKVEAEILIQDEEETKRITRVPRRNGKQEYYREEVKPKRKRIVKEKFVYKLSREEKALMELSRYRELKPELIMVGPQFQARIPPCRWFPACTSLPARQTQWLADLREKLLLRSYQ